MVYVPNGILNRENQRELPFWRTYCIRSDELTSFLSECNSTLSNRYCPSGTNLSDEHATTINIVITTKTGAINLYNFKDSIDILIILAAKHILVSAKKVHFQFAERSLFYAKIMQVRAKKVHFRFAERSLFYAKIMQVRAKKVYFQFAERSLFYAKVVKS